MLVSPENLKKKQKRTKTDNPYSEENSLPGNFLSLQRLYTIEGLWIVNILQVHVWHMLQKIKFQRFVWLS